MRAPIKVKNHWSKKVLLYKIIKFTRYQITACMTTPKL